jgi:hypothetical protein
MEDTQKLRPLAAIAVVLAAAWLATGAGYKWLAGSPNDLPSQMHALGLDIVLVYKLAIGIELAIVAAALLVPRIGWLLLALQYVVFLSVLGMQIAAGSASCGCFGSKITIAPEVMSGIDGALLALLVASRPWSANLWRAPLALAGIVVALGAAAPWLYTRQITTTGTPNGETPRAGFVLFDEKTWLRKQVQECDFVAQLDTPDGAESLMPGTWVFYRLSCPHCADHLEAMRNADPKTEPITLILIPEADLDPKSVVVHMKPEGAHVTEIALKSGIDYVMTGPVDLLVGWDYQVKSVRLAEELDVEGVAPFPTEQR